MRKLARAAQLFISALNMGAHDLHFAGIKLSWRIQNCGGQERLAIIMKQRGNAALLSTRYGKDELERFRLLNEVIRILSRSRRSA